MRLVTKKQLYDWVRQVAAHEDMDLGKPLMRGHGVIKGIIPAAYTSGNPQIQQWWETSTTVGSKTHKTIQILGSRSAAPAASDSIIFGCDPDGNKSVLGKLVNVGSGVIDADYIMGLRPVAPGNTLLLTANTEQSTTSASYVTLKRFFVTRPGRYRLKFALSRDGGTATAQVGIELPDGTITAASAETSYTGTVHPTYSSEQTADMTVTVAWGMFIVMQLKNTSGPTFTAYIQNVTMNYADASTALTPLDSVLTD